MLHRLPSPFAIYAVSAATIMGILAAVRGAVDSDYYWHITAGRLVAERGILTSDPFSYTWGGQPWVMHEWLGELVMYLLVNGVGITAAAFVFGLISAGGPLVVAAALRRQGIPPVAVVAVTTLVLYTYTSYATIRPQAISWLLLGLLLAGLLTTRPEHRWRPWLVLPLFVLWANVHGLYVIGLGVLWAYAAMTLLGWTPLAARKATVVAVALAALAASMVTPAGPEGILYPLRYIDPGDWGLQHISEWQSPDFHDPSQIGLLALILAVLANGMRATPRWLVVMAACGLIGALLATRNVPLTGLLVMPTLALGLADRLPDRLRARTRPLREQLARRALEIGIAVLLIATTLVVVPGLPAVADEHVIPRTFPVAAVDVLESAHPDARVFAEYQWGGYVSYRLFDEGARVFVDGRNDMYDEAILEDFVSLRNAEDGWQDVLRRWGADAFLLPPTAPIVRGPLQDEGWCEAHRDEVAVLLMPCADDRGAEEWQPGTRG